MSNIHFHQLHLPNSSPKNTFTFFDYISNCKNFIVMTKKCFLGTLRIYKISVNCEKCLNWSLIAPIKKYHKIPNNFQKKSWYENIRLIPYRKIPVYRDFAKIPYRTVPEWNSSYRWGLVPIVIAVVLPQAASSSHFAKTLLSVKPLNINLCISVEFAAILSTKKWTISWQNFGASLWSNIFQDNIFKYFPRTYWSKGTLKLPTCVGAISSKPFNPRSLYKKKKNLNKTTVPYLKSCLESEVNLWRLCSA